MTFYELEKKCKQRRLRIYSIFLVGIVLLIGIIYFLFSKFLVKSDSIQSHVNTIANKENIIENYNDENIYEENDNNMIENNKTAITSIKKDYSKINKIKEVKKSLIVKKENNKKENNETNSLNFSRKKDNIILSPVIPVVSENKKENTTIIKPKKISTFVNKKTSSIVQVEKLPSYDKCIRRAKEYLIEGKYKLALKWAKNANIQNKDLPDSWIVSAKALFYSGNKDKAIEILKIYLKYKKNERVKKLLRKLENEKDIY